MRDVHFHYGTDTLGPDLDLAEEHLQQLGVLHIDFGVMPQHYPLMGKALKNTIASKLGDQFTKRHQESWDTIYTFMSSTMLQGAFQELTKDRNPDNSNTSSASNSRSRKLEQVVHQVQKDNNELKFAVQQVLMEVRRMKQASSDA